jgi:DNA-binding NarL/FixJ family response regulator
MIRVLIADDQAMVREGFAVLLTAQPDITVVGEARDGRDAVDQARRVRPDVVLMDVRMPVLDGISATRQIVGNDPDSKVVILTTFDLDEYVYDALRAGASGFLLKTASARTLAEAVRVAAGGEAMLAPSVTRRLIAEVAKHRSFEPADRAVVAQLTDRETEVLVLIARGRSNAEISADLVIAEQTVKTHVGRILTKLGLRDRTQAAIWAYEAGLVRPGN